MTLVIAIDGPSGSGKSSTSRGVAERLSMAYLDTGAMYRAMTWALLRRGIDVDDSDSVARSCMDVTLRPVTDPGSSLIIADDVDVTQEIRSENVTSAVSAVSAVPQVRKTLVHMQQQIIADSGGIVVEGRDIGAVVAPHAQAKIYLVADPSARASRRAAETGDADSALTADHMAKRDHLDSTRRASPLEMPADAILIDSTQLTLDEVIDRIVDMVKDTA